jgi:hypothetical protein
MKGEKLIITVTVAVRSEALTVLAHFNTEVVGSNPTGGTDDCACLLCVCVALCVGSGLVTG